MFDINAPIEQQRSGSFKLLKIVDSGLDIEYPIAAWLESGRVNTFTRNGQCFANGPNSPCDLITLPEPLPLIVSYLSLTKYGPYGVWQSVESAEKQAHSTESIKTVMVVTFDPNTGESSAKTVWRKGV